MKMTDAYTDLLIRIRRKDEATGAYPVEAELEDGSVFSDGSFAIDLVALTALGDDSKQYGLMLFEALFSGSIRKAYDKAMGVAEAKTAGQLRLRLRIDDEAPELNALAWERLHSDGEGQGVALASSANTPLSRYTSLEIAQPAPVAQRPLRVLFAISNPANLPAGMQAVEVDEEVQALAGAVQEMQQAQEVQASILPGRSGLSEETEAQLRQRGFQIEQGPTSLENILRLLPKHHVFHFLGHGRFKGNVEEAGEGALFLEDEDGTWRPVTGTVLASKYGRLGRTRPHLTFLAACESAKGDGRHPFVGVGPKLVRAGAPAVIAMSEKVRVDLVRTLTGHFYRNLLDHGYVDLALNQARQFLETEGSDWAAPILFSRLKDNRLTVPASEVQAQSKRLIRNVGIMGLAVGLLAVYFYVHIYSYLLPGLVAGSALVGVLVALRLVQGFFKWSLGDLLKDRLLGFMASPKFAWASLAAVGAAILLFAATSSLYVSFDEEAALALGVDSLEVELRRGDEVLWERTRLSRFQPIVGQPFFLRPPSGNLKLVVVNPPIIKPLAVPKLYPSFSRTLSLDLDQLESKPVHVLRIVLSPFVASLPSVDDPPPPKSYSLRIKIDGQLVAEIDDLRRGQNFYLGSSREEIDYVSGQQDADPTIDAYFRSKEQFFRPEGIQKWKENFKDLASPVVVPLEHGDTVEIEVHSDGQIVAEATETLAQETDHDEQEVKTIILT